MANLYQTLISIALLLAAAANTAKSQSTNFAYDFWGDQPTELLYEGDAHFPSGTTFLRMTKTNASGSPAMYSAGRVVYPTPITFWEAGAQVDFETTVKFIITPNAGDMYPAEGFAFFIGPVGLPLGYFSNSLGVFNTAGLASYVFAVEFDIYFDSIWDPRFPHIGIDIESNISKNATNVGNALVGQEVTAIIGYKQATKLTTVRVAAGSQIYEVSYVFDLSEIVPQQVQVGISAATGDHFAVHDLISWYFTSTLVHTATAAGKAEEGYIRQYV